MLVMELFDPVPAGYRDERADGSINQKVDSRKNRLTLAHLNRLRQSHDVRKVEHQKKLETISKQYQPAPEAGAAMGGLGGPL